ncbi:hypothetical protein LCGC14_1892280 [marine sediment metagenome]|uniref:Uncharacterized protein n=1 Tax=marine sediment metagenome TaxID=412755 RepID=A0A0F9GMD0_9ZZZZ
MTRVRVVKNPDEPETKEILAEAVVRISKALTVLQESGLNEEAIVVLVRERTKLPKGAIRDVFAALRQLRGWYCR